MKNRSLCSPPGAKILAYGLLSGLFLSSPSLNAAQLEETHVTQVVKHASVGRSEAALRQVAVGESVRDGDAINTGATGQIELTLPDRTIVRLGAKTNVSFNDRTSTMDLGEGAVLFQIPKGTGRLKLKSNTIAVASTGATGIIERHGQFYVKLLVLEGTVRCYLTNRLGESLLLQPGQILITKPNVTALPEPANFDIAREMKTCLLVREFQPLPSQGRIEAEEQKQLKLIAKGTYIPSNLVILGRGTQVTLVNAASTTPSPKPQTNTGHQPRAP